MSLHSPSVVQMAIRGTGVSGMKRRGLPRVRIHYRAAIFIVIGLALLALAPSVPPLLSKIGLLSACDQEEELSVP